MKRTKPFSLVWKSIIRPQFACQPGVRAACCYDEAKRDGGTVETKRRLLLETPELFSILTQSLTGGVLAEAVLAIRPGKPWPTQTKFCPTYTTPVGLPKICLAL